MAYAKLVFPASIPVLKKLKDIAKIIVGITTSTAQLEFATAASSEVITTDPAGWSLADTSFEVSGTATISEYRMSAPCVNPAKTKYAAIRSMSVITTQNTVATMSTAAATSASLFCMVGTDITAGALSNAAWYMKTMPGSTYNYSVTLYPCVDLSGTTFYISATNRKILIFSIGTTIAPGTAYAYNGVQTILEFPETAATVKYNNLPVLHFSSLANNPDIGISSVNYLTNTVALSVSGQASKTSIAVFTNWYSETDGTRAVRDSNNTAVKNIIDLCNIIPHQTILETGTVVYPLIPIIDIRTNLNEGIHEYSKLTDVYLTYKPASYATSGDELTVGANTYVIISPGISSTPNNSRVLCIKKA